jgi:hypothetical protein
MNKKAGRPNQGRFAKAILKKKAVSGAGPGIQPAPTPAAEGGCGISILLSIEREYTDREMTIDEFYIVFPEGECQELETALRIDELVDLNGRSLALPLPSPRMIVYRVVKIRHTEERGTHSVFHYVELVPSRELLAYTSSSS